MNLFRVLGSVVTLAGALMLSTPRGVEAFEGFEECTQAQWLECICSSTDDCSQSNPPLDPGWCWLGEIEVCDGETGNCTGGCYMYQGPELCEVLPGC